MDITPDPAAKWLVEITPFFENTRGGKIRMLRLDQLHPLISGNKWFKLKYNLLAAVRDGFEQVLTFGGAYSNHLVATAVAAQQAGLSAIGVVRGFHGASKETPTLQTCRQYGMMLHFVSREDYHHKDQHDFIETLQSRFGRSTIIPEGGCNEAGRHGAGDIALLIPETTTTVCLPVGTGTTFAGLRNRLPEDITMIGFTVMKGGAYLQEEIAMQLDERQNRNWQLNTAYALNGFGKSTPGLIEFIQQFYRETGVPLDIVYTGKMMLGIRDMIRQNAFAEGEQILCIHTGGLQGNPAGLFT